MAGRYMTDGEIITSYRQAKSPVRQIGVIAQLNLMPRSKVEDILIAAGFKIKRRPDPFRDELTKDGQKRTFRKWTAEEDRTLIRMAKEGKTIKEICVKLKRATSSVCERRRLWKREGKI
ncbi:MAG: hypothetical protein IJ281_03855 [Clostridia bacterium]|nr:hypothetical protein [Clostridia bacterium]